jgi:hypothetical protein
LLLWAEFERRIGVLHSAGFRRGFFKTLAGFGIIRGVSSDDFLLQLKPVGVFYCSFTPPSFKTVEPVFFCAQASTVRTPADEANCWIMAPLAAIEIFGQWQSMRPLDFFLNFVGHVVSPFIKWQKKKRPPTSFQAEERCKYQDIYLFVMTLSLPHFHMRLNQISFLPSADPVPVPSHPVS